MSVIVQCVILLSVMALDQHSI